MYQKKKIEQQQKINIVIKSFPKHDSIIQDIIKSGKRYNILCSSRQFGKTSIATKLIIYWLLNDIKQSALYVTPTYSLAKKAFKNIIEGLGKQVIKEANKSEVFIKFINGSELYFKSATNDTAIRGGTYNYVIVDEFSYIEENVWEGTIRPTMNVAGKQSLLVSTPKGKNLFHKMFLFGQDKNSKLYKSYRGHYTDNPLYNRNEVENAKKTIPPNTYRQEYEGEFLDDGGTVFTNLENVSTLERWIKNEYNLGPYYAGLDLGRKSDFCVLTVFNNKNEVVEIYKANKVSWNLLVNNIVSVLKKYNARCLVEINGIGDPIFEQLKREYRYVTDFLTTNDSKNQIIEELILAINEGTIRIPSSRLFPDLHFEFDTFTFEYSNKSRKIFYGAKSGFHDDCIMSLAMANHARSLQNTRKLYVY